MLFYAALFASEILSSPELYKQTGGREVTAIIADASCRFTLNYIFKLYSLLMYLLWTCICIVGTNADFSVFLIRSIPYWD